MVSKVSRKEVNYLIKDEGKASREYAKLGFPRLAGDEKRHQRFWKKYKAKGWHSESDRHRLASYGIKTVTRRNHTYFELGGGLFTKKQVLEAKRRQWVEQ